MTRFSIRQMQKNESREVRQIMRRSFPLFQQLFFSLTPETLVAVSEKDKPVGAVVLKTFSLPGGEKSGVIYWIFTDPKVRGQGLGQALMDAGLETLSSAGCSQISAIVEGFNTSSSNLFASRGFSILPFREQIRRFGWSGTAKMWWENFHIPDIGHFLWGKPPSGLEDTPGPQFSATLLLNILCGLLALWRGTHFGLPNITALWAIPFWIVLLIELRTVLVTFSARKQALKLRFRMWESGFSLGFLLALAFGFYFPIPGSLYPEEDIWHYRTLIPKYGRIALNGTLPALLLSWGLFLTLELFSASGWLQTFLYTGFEIALTFSIFDLLLVFFPFVSYNGRRIWDWRKPVWGLLAAALIGLMALNQIF
jgi:GNAT superfamily N-acetyltransferase